MMRAASRRRLSPLLLLAVALIALTAAHILVPRPASADHRPGHHGPGDGCGIYELSVAVGDGTRHQVDKISRDSTNPTEVKVSSGNPEITVKRQPMDRFVWVYRLHYDNDRPEQYRLARLARFPNRAQGPDFYFRFYLTDEEGSAPLEVGESRMVRIFLWVKRDRLEDCDYKALLSYHLKVTRVADGETLGFVEQSGQQPSGMSGDAPPPPDNQPPAVSSAISDTTITNESGWQVIPLAGVFADADGDLLTLEATSSNYAVAFGYVQYLQGPELVVLAGRRGTAQITVTANDERGGTVSDTFTVKVKAAPAVASALADVDSLDAAASKRISLSGVFSDADGDSLTVTASSSKDAVTMVAVAADYSGLTVSGKGEGTATITVTAWDSDDNTVSDAFDVTVVKANNPPTVASAIADATITNESGTHGLSLFGVFDDADGDSLTITASSSNESVATASVSADYSTLLVTAKARGTATVTVTAADGRGGSVEDSFTVTVKAAPTVASAIADISGLEAEDSRNVSLSGVFSDADGDAVTVTNVVSSDSAIAAVSVSIDGATSAITGLTVLAKSEGTATVTVTAQDADGNTVQDAFDVTVNAAAEQLQKANNPPTVANAIADATIVNESGSHQVSLSSVFSDADGDALTVKAASSAETVATVAVANDNASLTVSAQARGSATITVTASDGYGGSVTDTFTVKVKAAPVVAAAIPDATMVEVSSQEVDLSKVFNDADGDTLTYTVSSTDLDAVAVFEFHSAMTVLAITEGKETVTVTAQDADGNQVSDAFTVTVTAPVELPGPVLDLELTATHDSVSVSWSAPESGDAPDGYIVHIKRQGGGDGETRRPGADKTALTFGGLNSGRTYEVWVRAQNEAGKGERTRATVTLPAVLPGPVTGLEVAATEDGVTVSWRAPETGGAPDGYIVHLKPEDGGSGRTKTPRAKKTKVSFDNLEAGQTYEVWVRAQNEAGKGERVHASVTLPEADPTPEEGDDQTGQ